MENAGAVTFREVALLADPATAPLAVQKRIAEVITHELAHQWFGNLVTMAWWDDLWLNEAFATWMAYKIVDDWRPSWRIWMDFEAGKGAALALDALVSAHPIRAEIQNAEEAGESFDAITYEKGGAVLRMLEGFLGEDRFRDGIRLYMRRHREANATADDLWAALGEASGQPILEMANGWIRQTGYPLVSLAIQPGRGRRRGAAAATVLRRAGRRRARAGHPLAGAGRVALPGRRGRQGTAGAAVRRGRSRPAERDGRGGLVHRQRRGARVLPHRVRRRRAGAPLSGGGRAAAGRAGRAALRLMGAGPGRRGANQRIFGSGGQPAPRDGPRGAGRAGRAPVADRAPLRRRGRPRPVRGVRGRSVRRRRRKSWDGAGWRRRGRRDAAAPGGAAARAGAAGARPGAGGRGRGAPARRPARPPSWTPTCWTRW